MRRIEVPVPLWMPGKALFLLKKKNGFQPEKENTGWVKSKIEKELQEFKISVFAIKAQSGKSQPLHSDHNDKAKRNTRNEKIKTKETELKMKKW